MIWRIDHLPHGRVVGTCKTCGHATLHPTLRTAELWARRHDVVTCVMTKQSRRDERANPTHARAANSTPEANPYPDTFPTPHSASLETQ